MTGALLDAGDVIPEKMSQATPGGEGREGVKMRRS